MSGPEHRSTSHAHQEDWRSPAGQYERSWRYFQLLVDQRFRSFNYFVLIGTVALTASAYVASEVLKQASPLETCALGVLLIGLMLAYISALFLTMDKRNRVLIENARYSLVELERQMGIAPCHAVLALQGCFDQDNAQANPYVHKVLAAHPSRPAEPGRAMTVPVLLAPFGSSAGSITMGVHGTLYVFRALGFALALAGGWSAGTAPRVVALLVAVVAIAYHGRATLAKCPQLCAKLSWATQAQMSLCPWPCRAFVWIRRRTIDNRPWLGSKLWSAKAAAVNKCQYNCGPPDPATEGTPTQDCATTKTPG